MYSKKLIWILVFFLMMFSGAHTQTKQNVETAKFQEKLKQRKINNQHEVERILAEEYANEYFSNLKQMNREERRLFMEKTINNLKPVISKYVVPSNIEVASKNFYKKHVHPSKIKQLNELGVFSSINSIIYYAAVYSETVIIGRVRKFVYHPDKLHHFHTSVYVTVDEYLRDDYGLSKKTKEIIVKLESGPIGEETWGNWSHEPHFRIGQKLLIFVSRSNYIRELVWNAKYSQEFKTKEFSPNIFTIVDIAIINNDAKVKWRRESKDLRKIKTEIRKVVEVLDVNHFYHKDK